MGLQSGRLHGARPAPCARGAEDLRRATAALGDAGIGVLLDVVFNHSGESDEQGPTLSLRGLDNALYYRHSPDGSLVNDAGCGNILACDEKIVADLVLDSLRRFARAGVAGFRFDLATTLGRRAAGFDPQAPLLKAIAGDPVLGRLELIAEPWDIGPGGYQVGRFGAPWKEWNDRYRDDVRRFWRGDRGAAGAFATRICGSADLFAHDGRRPSANVNFVAAHDGFRCAISSRIRTSRTGTTARKTGTAIRARSPGTTDRRARRATRRPRRVAKPTYAHCWPRCSCRAARRC